MYDFTDSPLVHTDKTLVLAHDHDPKRFDGVEERLGPPRRVRNGVDPVTVVAVGRGR